MTPLLRTGAGLWNDFAALIGVAPRHAEAALYSERAARASLSRRSLFGVSAALAAGVAFGFPAAQAESRRKVFFNGEWYDVFAVPVGLCGIVGFAIEVGSNVAYDFVSKYPESLIAS